MHVANLIAIILCCVFIVESRLINDVDEIARINSVADSWQAGHNSRFDDMTEEQASKLLGLTETPVQVSEAVARDVSAAQGLPTNYDARTRYPNCIMPIRDQGTCGACWAFAGTSVLSTRMCIQSGGAVKVDMSPQVSINCNTAQNGCNGGTLGGAWDYFKKSGSVADSSYPFSGKKGTCSVSSSAKRYFAASYYRPSTVAAMQQAIYNDGAIQVGLDIYNDFYSYKSGVYKKTSNQLAGGHSVYLVGWGTDASGTDYWIGVNSWGTSWGNKGTFMIQRGVNMVNIEKGYLPVAGDATVPASTPTTTTKAPTTTTTTKAPTTRAPTTTTTTKAPTTRAPVTTSTTAKPNCWTCSPGYVHWYDIPGYAAPSDKCACVKTSTTTTTTKAPTTKAPTSLAQATAKLTTKAAVATTRPNCWTCSPGYVHWYDIPGMAEPSDKCACVANTLSRNCWTCPSGYVHWYDIPGYKEPSDKCACVPK